MGQEKERMIEREEAANRAATSEGKTCAYCAAPLLTRAERRRGSCDRCEHIVTKG